MAEPQRPRRVVSYEPLTAAELAEDRASLVGQRLEWEGREAAYVRVDGRIVGVVYKPTKDG